MAKLTIATVLLLALLAVAQVSCFRTIVTTTIEEESQQGSQERCRQQVQQKYQQLQSCKRYLQQSSRPFELDMVVNPQQQQEQQQLRQCCQPLRQLGECSCEAIKQVVEEQLQQFGQGGQQSPWEQGGQQGQWGPGSQQGQQGQQQVQQMLQKARNLPRQCNIRHECQIQSPFNY